MCHKRIVLKALYGNECAKLIIKQVIQSVESINSGVLYSMSKFTKQASNVKIPNCIFKSLWVSRLKCFTMMMVFPSEACQYKFIDNFEMKPDCADANKASMC